MRDERSVFVRANLFIKPRLTAYTANDRGDASVGATSSISGPSDKRTFTVLRGESRPDCRGPDNACVCVFKIFSKGHRDTIKTFFLILNIIINNNYTCINFSRTNPISWFFLLYTFHTIYKLKSSLFGFSSILSTYVYIRARIFTRLHVFSS